MRRPSGRVVGEGVDKAAGNTGDSWGPKTEEQRRSLEEAGLTRPADVCDLEGRGQYDRM